MVRWNSSQTYINELNFIQQIDTELSLQIQVV